MLGRAKRVGTLSGTIRGLNLSPSVRTVCEPESIVAQLGITVAYGQGGPQAPTGRSPPSTCVCSAQISRSTWLGEQAAKDRARVSARAAAGLRLAWLSIQNSSTAAWFSFKRRRPFTLSAAAAEDRGSTCKSRRTPCPPVRSQYDIQHMTPGVLPAPSPNRAARGAQS